MKKEPRAKGILRLNLKSKRHLNAIMQALKPELAHPASDRTHVVMTPKGRTLTLRFHASNSSSLRAIMSSYLRMLAASFAVLESLPMNSSVKQASVSRT